MFLLLEEEKYCKWENLFCIEKWLTIFPCLVYLFKKPSTLNLFFQRKRRFSGYVRRKPHFEKTTFVISQMFAILIKFDINVTPN